MKACCCLLGLTPCSPVRFQKLVRTSNPTAVSVCLALLCTDVASNLATNICQAKGSQATATGGSTSPGTSFLERNETEAWSSFVHERDYQLQEQLCVYLIKRFLNELLSLVLL